jgi:bifunctional DNase/RNase
MNNNTELFELIECELTQIVFENNTDYIVAIHAKEEEWGIPLNSYDGTILTFVDTGCAEFAHINTIHQLYMKLKKECKFELERVIIEAKYGDVFYCRLHWKNKDNNIYNTCGIGDALILHRLNLSPMFITKNVLAQLEKFDSDGFVETFEF